MKSALLSLVALLGLAAQSDACPIAAAGVCSSHAVAVQAVVPVQTFAVVAPVAVVQQHVVVPQAVHVQTVGVAQVLVAPVVKVKNACVLGHCGRARVQVFGGRSVERQRQVIRSR